MHKLGGKALKRPQQPAIGVSIVLAEKMASDSYLNVPACLQ
jgi:hypothetical protein